MLPVIPNAPGAKEIAVQAATHQFDLAMAALALYMYVSNTNSWIKQGTAYLLTLTTTAGHGAADTVSITYDGTTVVYELDKAGDGVAAGNVQVNIFTDVTAAQVAARLRTAILANQAALSVTDNTDGTLTVQLNGKLLTVTESGAATAAITPLIPTQADGSMYVPANYPVLLTSALGPYLASIRDTADGKATLVRVGVM